MPGYSSTPCLPPSLPLHTHTHTTFAKHLSLDVRLFEMGAVGDVPAIDVALCLCAHPCCACLGRSSACSLLHESRDSKLEPGGTVSGTQSEEK